jgi:intracellular septation protein A
MRTYKKPLYFLTTIFQANQLIKNILSNNLHKSHKSWNQIKGAKSKLFLFRKPFNSDVSWGHETINQLAYT